MHEKRVVSIDNAEHYSWGAQCDGWHLVRSDRISIIQERVPPGAAEVKHYHERAWQFFFVLQGQATIEIEEERVILNAREGLEIPPGLPHQFRNDSGEELIFIVISSPRSHGDRIVL